MCAPDSSLLFFRFLVDRMPPAIIAPLDPFARRAGDGIELERRSVLCTSRGQFARSIFCMTQRRLPGVIREKWR
jgi:hypothetical protein